jgi:acyl-CoA thioesterase-1
MQKFFFVFRLKNPLLNVMVFCLPISLFWSFLDPLVAQSASSSERAKSRKLIIIGDSLTEGYGVSKEQAFPALIEKKIKQDGKNWIVINSGISGSTTASAESRFRWVLRSKPDMVMFALGANDGLRGVKVEESEKNLEKVIRMAQEAKVRVILAGLYIPPNYGKEYGIKFRALYERLSKKYNLPFVSFLLEGVGGVPELNLADGIHPNEKGHQKIADNAYKVLKDLL